MLRSRLAVATLALAGVLGTACGTVPGDVVAVVDGVEIPYSRFDQIMSRSTQYLGLSGSTLEIAERAEAAGLLRRDLLDSTLIQATQSPDVDANLLPQLPEALLDALWFEQFEFLSDDEAAALLDEVGVDEGTYRTVFDQIAVAEMAGLFQTGAGGFALDRSSQVRGVQSNVIGQLIEFQFTQLLVDRLEIEIPQEDIDLQFEFVAAQFDTDEELAIAVGRLGYTPHEYRDIVVANQVRTTALQGVQDPDLIADLQAYIEGLEVEVAPRFGSFDIQLGLTPPVPLDG